MTIKHRLKNVKDMRIVKARRKPKTSAQKARNLKAKKYAKTHKSQIRLAAKKRENRKTSADRNFEKRHKAEVAKHDGKHIKKTTKVVTTISKIAKPPAVRKTERLRLREAKLSERAKARNIMALKMAQAKKVHDERLARLKADHQKRIDAIKARAGSPAQPTKKKRIRKSRKQSFLRKKVNGVRKAAKKIIRKIKNGTHKSVRNALSHF